MRPTHVPDYTLQQLTLLYEYNHLLPLYLYVPIIIIISGFSFSHLLSNLLRNRRRASSAECIRARTCRAPAECSRSGIYCTKWIPGTLLAICRKALVRKSRTAAYVHMGSLGQVFFVIAFLGWNLLLAMVGADSHIDFQAHHCARLATANLPLLAVLASKNNPISYLTGFSYESLNVFHRWAARVVLLLVCIHIGGRIYVNFPNVDISSDGGAHLIWGMVAFVALLLMVLGASRFLRNKRYQFFIISHVILFLVFTSALWLHRRQLAPWIYTSYIIYFLDRFIRTGRIIWFHSLHKVDQGKEIAGEKDDPESQEEDRGGTVQTVSGGTILVRVKTKMRWMPGQHIYLHVPFLSAGGHPFTVSSIPSSNEDNDSISTQTMIIRVREGLTRRLFALPPSSPPTPTAYLPGTVWTEGPYGNQQYLDFYATLVLVAGGSGVSFTLPVMMDIVRRARGMWDATQRENGTGDAKEWNGDAVATLRLTFIWIIKKQEHIEWIEPVLRQALSLAPPGFLNLHVYVTSPSSSDVPTSIPTISHRPHFATLLSQEIAKTSYGDDVAVATCGPAAMASDLARAVSDAILLKCVAKGERRRNVYFYQEEYGW